MRVERGMTRHHRLIPGINRMEGGSPRARAGAAHPLRTPAMPPPHPRHTPVTCGNSRATRPGETAVHHAVNGLTGLRRSGYVARHAAIRTPDDARSCRPEARVLRGVSPGLNAPRPPPPATGALPERARVTVPREKPRPGRVFGTRLRLRPDAFPHGPLPSRTCDDTSEASARAPPPHHHPAAPLGHPGRRTRPPCPGHRLRAERDPRPRARRPLHRRPAHRSLPGGGHRPCGAVAGTWARPRGCGDRRAQRARPPPHPRGDRHRPLSGRRGPCRRRALHRLADGPARPDRRRGPAAARRRGEGPVRHRPRRLPARPGDRARPAARPRRPAAPARRRARRGPDRPRPRLRHRAPGGPGRRGRRRPPPPGLAGRPGARDPPSRHRPPGPCGQPLPGVGPRRAAVR